MLILKVLTMERLQYYKDTCAIRKSDMIAFLQENSVYSLKDGIGECEARSIYYDLFRFR